MIPETSDRVVPGVGPKDAKIAIVGEAPGAQEDMRLKPFVGPAGMVLEQCMHTARIIRGEVYLTNVVKVRPPRNDITPYFSSYKGTFTPAGREWVERLREELREVKCNVIVACGVVAMAALTGLTRIMTYRGYVCQSIGLDPPRKVIPSIHPARTLRGEYVLRHLIVADLKKAKAESRSPEWVRPDRTLVTSYSSVNDVLEWLYYYEGQPIVCFDIEVLNYELSCISFSSDPSLAISIPLARRWSEEEEMQIWRGIQRVLGNPKSVKVCQNGIFDIHFLLTRCGIEVRGEIRDTMIGHHVMYTELPKGLAFLGSIYCGSQPYWKDMAKFKNVKEDA